MAIIRYSGIIAALSGNVGPLNFVHGKSGPVLRRARRASRQLSAKQLRMQANMNTVLNAWNALTDANRMAWHTLAKQLVATNSLGVPHNLTGRSLFFRRNLRNLAFLPGFTETDPPPFETSPAVTNLTIDTTAPATIELDWDTPISLPVGLLFIYAARAHSTAPSKFFTTHTAIGTQGLFVLPLDISNDFIAALGTPQAGELISVKIAVRLINFLDSPATTAQTHMA